MKILRAINLLPSPLVYSPIGRRAFEGLLILLCAFLSPQLRLEGQIFYEATDLSDTTSGEDLWRYTYNIRGFSFETGQGLSIFFDPVHYRNLQNPPPPVNADWSVISVQPDLVLGRPGFYDGQALRNSPSLGDAFAVSFVWSGQGTPGSQPFDLYNADFSTRFSGQTVGVPEPKQTWLMALVLAGGTLAIKRARRNRMRTSSHEGHKF